MRERLRDLGRELEQATGLLGMLRAFGALPGRVSWLRSPGAVLGALIAVQIVTGVALATYYSPSATTSWGSVLYIETEVTAGSFVRGLHAFGASAIVIFLLVHGLSVGLRRAYAGPRRWNWILGLVLVQVVLVFALTGYLLPWDQKGYWATQVATGIMRGTPIVGETVAQVFQGGTDMGNRTLTRFYALHTMVLPFTLLLLIGLHLRMLARARSAKPEDGATPYWPGQAFRDALLATVVLGVVAALAAAQGAGLEAPADPNSDYPPRPEWYFAPLRELLKTIPEPWGSVVLPGALVTLLGALPWIDGGKRPRAAKAILLLPLLAWGGLLLQTTLKDAADPEFQAARERADDDAKLARELARGGIPAQDPADLLRHYPPRYGAELFEIHCRECHAIGGKGGAEGPHLTGYLSLNWLREVIKDPNDPRYYGNVESLVDAMPALDEEHLPKLNAIATYVRSLDPEAAKTLPPKLIEEGRAAYLAAECNACHKTKQGAEDLGPNLHGYGTPAWLKAFLKDPAHPLFYGEDNAMPGYADELDDAQLDALVVYLRELASK